MGPDEPQGSGQARSGRHASCGTYPERRILIIEGHPLMRRGLIALIDAEPDLSVCATAGTRRAALAALEATRPDLIITELALPDDEDWALLETIRSSGGAPPVLVFSMRDASRHARRAFRAGASGYVSKRETGAVLLAAIRVVLAGRQYPTSLEDELDTE